MITKLSKFGPYTLPCEICGEWRIYDRKPFTFDEETWERNKLFLLPCTNCFIENNKTNLSKKEWKRLHFIISGNMYISFEIATQRINNKSYFEHFRSYSNGIKLQNEAHQLFVKLGMDETMRRGYWVLKYSERKASKEEYNKKPIRVRKDNKDIINYGSGNPQSAIRYPRKKRKTAWKRFYKLFPHLDPNTKK